MFAVFPSRDDGRLPSPGEVPRSRTGILWTIAAVVIGVVVYLVFKLAVWN